MPTTNAQVWRNRVLDKAGRRFLLARFSDTDQEKDLSVPANCEGFGRVHHFRRNGRPGWPCNPLPIDPACKALGYPAVDEMTAEVFQLAACTLGCWYCYVPRILLTADEHYAKWFTAEELVSAYDGIVNRPKIIDISGGNPGLAPEWVVWMMRALEDRNLANTTYLWADDNLTVDFSDGLTPQEQKYVATYPNFGKVGCFKGYDVDSFVFNTGSDETVFARQFEVMSTLVASGVDTYAYVTLTGPHSPNLKDDVARFVDRLSSISPNLPLRTVPLLIKQYTPVAYSMNAQRQDALKHQYKAAECWVSELERRFPTEQRQRRICDIVL